MRKVEHFGDLKVKYSPFGTDCGEWRLVDVGEDFTVEFVIIGEDFTIEEVDHFPGL